ncbi:hypothetical protein N9D31_00640 [Oligoflexaceae bacterium]|nr:hypothetical protein [Oligoflexaceae bacterium]
MQKLLLLILATFISNTALSAELVYSPTKGSKSHCKEGLLVKTSSKVVGSKYKLGSIIARRFAKNNETNKTDYFDADYRITQSRFDNDPSCRSKNLSYNFYGCGSIEIKDGMIGAKYVEHLKDEIVANPADKFGFDVHPFITAYEIKMYKGKIQFRKFHGAVSVRGNIDQKMWRKMLYGSKAETCVYERAR